VYTVRVQRQNPSNKATPICYMYACMQPNVCPPSIPLPKHQTSMPAFLSLVISLPLSPRARNGTLHPFHQSFGYLSPSRALSRSTSPFRSFDGTATCFSPVTSPIDSHRALSPPRAVELLIVFKPRHVSLAAERKTDRQ
jgi:hypothetical protein